VRARVPPDAVVVTNPPATERFLNELHGYHRVLDYRRVDGRTLQRAAARGPVFLVFVSRADSAYWARDAGATRRFESGLADAFRALPLLDADTGGGQSVRIARLEPLR
jgi:hypothetical protein